jgi:phosphate starvation-inducible PhoH-like protein
VVRHPVVARIVEAYERNDEAERLKRAEKQRAKEAQANQQEANS